MLLERLVLVQRVLLVLQVQLVCKVYKDLLVVLLERRRNAEQFGAEIAQELKAAKVDGAILTST